MELIAGIFGNKENLIEIAGRNVGDYKLNAESGIQNWENFKKRVELEKLRIQKKTSTTNAMLIFCILSNVCY